MEGSQGDGTRRCAPCPSATRVHRAFPCERTGEGQGGWTSAVWLTCTWMPPSRDAIHPFTFRMTSSATRAAMPGPCGGGITSTKCVAPASSIRLRSSTAEPRSSCFSQYCSESVISDGSRPTSAQCRCRISTLRVKSSRFPVWFQISAYFANSRSIRGCLAPIQIGGPPGRGPRGRSSASVTL